MMLSALAMKTLFAGMLLLAGGTAQAQTSVIARAGGWTAFGGTTDRGAPTCGLDTRDSRTGRHLLIQYYSGQPRLLIRLIRLDWNIPPNTDVPVRIIIDNRGWSATAAGVGREVAWGIGRDTLGEFEAAFRRGSGMRVEFQQMNEPPWTFNLIGANPIMAAFGDCMRATLGPPVEGVPGAGAVPL